VACCIQMELKQFIHRLCCILSLVIVIVTANGDVYDGENNNYYTNSLTISKSKNIPLWELQTMCKKIEKNDAIFGTPIAIEEISIYIPSTNGVSKPISYEEHIGYVRGMATMLSELAGGATSTPGYGFYVSDTGKLIEESVTVVTVSINLTKDIKEEIVNMAKWLSLSLHQESVMLKVNGAAYLIKRPEAILSSS